MQDIRIGGRFRALRQRLGWRQRDLAVRAGISQHLVSLLERGRLEAVALDKTRRVAHALDAELLVQLRWRGGDLDRLVDQAHANLVGRVVEWLTARSWECRVEVSYSVDGERGSIDVLAWHAATRTLLIVEVKSELVSVEATLRKHDEKVRLAPGFSAERFGWRPARVARLLVLPSLATPRRRVAQHGAVMATAYPRRRSDLRRWLTAPATPVDSTSGILFLGAENGIAERTAPRKRIRPGA